MINALLCSAIIATRNFNGQLKSQNVRGYIMKEKVFLWVYEFDVLKNIRQEVLEGL